MLCSKFKMVFQRKIQIFSLVVIMFLMVYLTVWYNNSGLSPPIWNTNISRNVTDYVSEILEPHIIPENFCTESKLLLVIVCSRANGFEARQAIRETWGQKHKDASFYFLLGEVNDQTLQHEIEAESIQSGDIIQERFVDTYNNLSLKSVNMLKLFTIYCAANYDFLMKIDDDVFLNMPLFMKKLMEYRDSKNLFLGRIKLGTPPYRDPRGKWYMPYEWYPNNTYPSFLCGPAYVMSRNVVQKLYRCALKTPLLHIEDVYLTGICAKQLNITLTNSNCFTCNSLHSSICQYKSLYTLHYYTAGDIRSAYQILEDNYCEDYEKFSVLKHWIFFLNYGGLQRNKNIF